MAHGFTQTGRSWGPFGQALAERRRLALVDLPGHGGSSDVRADLPTAGRLLLEAAGPGPIDLLGYSLGARVALHAALADPGAVRRMVLIGATAGLEDPARRAERRRRDEALADQLEGDDDLEGFLQRWLAQPMFARLGATAGLDERRQNTPAGLASSLRLAGTGTQEPLWPQLARLAIPTLVVAGADDVRFTAVGRRLVDALADATWALVPGAGHAAHLEQPGLSARVVAHWLEAGDEA